VGESLDQTGVVVRFPTARGRLLTKRQIAGELGRSTRWVELRMREGLPVLPRSSPSEHARFDLEAVRAWLAGRPERVSMPIEERVARLERQVSTLAAALARERA
jgi:phage terminase Nu1 subunit (DNA packaging protein)